MSFSETESVEDPFECTNTDNDEDFIVSDAESESDSDPKINKMNPQKDFKQRWRRSVSKKCKTHGLEYANTSGHVVPAKKEGKPCSCKFRCFEKVRNGPDEYRVCKDAMTSVFDISKTRLERVANHLKTSCTVPVDARGLHQNRPNKIKEVVLQQIAEHINSFPKYVSHYSRKDNVKHKYRYLSLNLSVAKMHTLYLQKYEPEQYALLQDNKPANPKVKYDFYRKYFVENFKLSFGTPQSVTCSKCDTLMNKIKSDDNEEERKALQTCFGAIEVRKKKYDRIYLPDEYHKIIREAGRKFGIINVNQDMIINFKGHFLPILRKVVSTKKYKFTLSKYRLFKYDTQEMPNILCSEAVGMLTYTGFAILKKGAIPTLPTNAALLYSRRRILKPKKFET
nr:unnamed protein product [Callosobruchus analis]